MPKTLVISYENLPDDADVEIVGLGVFPNHSETVIEDDRITLWKSVGQVPGDVVDAQGDVIILPPAAEEDV